MWLKILVIILFLAVLVCLGRGTLLPDHRSQWFQPGWLNSLTARIILTALIMLIIVIAWLHGDITSHAPMALPLALTASTQR